MHYNELLRTTQYYFVLHSITMYYSEVQCTTMYYSVLQSTNPLDSGNILNTIFVCKKSEFQSGKTNKLKAFFVERQEFQKLEKSKRPNFCKNLKIHENSKNRNFEKNMKICGKIQ